MQKLNSFFCAFNRQSTMDEARIGGNWSHPNWMGWDDEWRRHRRHDDAMNVLIMRRKKSSSQRRWIDRKRKESPFVISSDIFTFLIVIHSIHHSEMLFQETITDNDIFQARNETYILSSSCKSWARGAHAYSIFKFSTSIILVPPAHYSFLQLKRVK